MSMGGAERPFAAAVDAYAADEGISLAETFRRIADVTGNPSGSVAMRYRNRGAHVWSFAAPQWRDGSRGVAGPAKKVTTG